jgi:glycosyltransferase involved in cell wall biosynthesis
LYLIIISIFLTSLLHLDFRGGYVYQIWIILLAFLIAKSFSIEEFSVMFNRYIFILSIISILVFIAAISFDWLLNYFPVHVNTAGVEFTGMLKNEEIVEIFSKGGVFCLPSYIENTPNTVMEAMAAGLPVVATKVGNLVRMVADGESGFLDDKQDLQGIRDALLKVFNNPDSHDRLGRRGREIASKRWKPGIIAQKHVAMYKDLMGAIKEL